MGYTVRNPSRSAFDQAPRNLVLVDFGSEEYGYQASWSRSGGGPTVLQETHFNSTLGFANLYRSYEFEKQFPENVLLS